MSVLEKTKKLQLQTVSISGFKCFKEQEFILPGNGLYFITGQNLETPASGSNGVGKSSLFEAIFWALYGKTPRGYKASTLLNENGTNKGYSVTLTFASGTVFRSWTPNKLTLDGKEVDQEAITRFIGLTPEQFLCSIYFEQKGKGFLDLTAGEKLSFLSDIFQLDRWTKASDKAAELVKALSTELIKLEAQKEAKVNELSANLAQLEENASNSMAWFSIYQEDVELALAALNDIKAEDIGQVAVSGITRLLAIDQEILKISTEIKKIDLEIKEITAQINKNNTAMSVIELEFKKIDKKKTALETTTACPECLQTITEAHRQTHLESLLKQVATLDSDHSDLSLNTVNLEVVLEELTADKTSYAQQLIIQEKAKSTLQAEERANKGLQEAYKKRLDQAQAAYDKALNAVNPYIAMDAKLEDNLAKGEIVLDALEAKIAETEKSLADYKFWQPHYPRIRLSILQEVIQELDFYLNSSLAVFGFSDWAIKISTERELKNETIKPELNVTLLKGGKEVNISTRSGGEVQRLAIVTALGISELIKSRLGISSDLILLDEPSVSLSEEGIAHTIELLTSLKDSSTILLADHSALSQANFDGVYTLVKDESGNTTIRNY